MDGYLNSGFVVIISGVYEDGLLTVKKFTLPDGETRSESRSLFSQIDLWHFEAYQKI